MNAQRSSNGDDWQESIADTELAQRVADALRHTGHPALAKLHVSSRFGVVTLQGPVPNTYLKVLAMTAALTVGGWWVVNCLEVPVSCS